MKDLIRVLNGQKSEKVPFWFMRQAGRYLPEYRALRAKKGGFLAMAFDPQAACEITVQPIRRFGMSGAILFSDILTVPMALGQDLRFEAGEGPVLGKLERLGFERFDAVMQPVYDAVSLIKAQLAVEGFDNTALIGFAGAPWTVAIYMVEGGGSKDFMAVKAMAYGRRAEFQALIDMLVEATARYLIAQIEAGAEAVKIFDSWAGVLPEEAFVDWVIQPTTEIVRAVKAVYPNVPVMGFPRGAGLYYERYIRETGVDACAVDQMMPLAHVKNVIQPLVPVQGNMDPAILMAGGEILRTELYKILDALDDKPFIFNLGHGVNKDTPVKHVQMLADLIRNYR
jgi:uroporphyrinogen decarboxylase